MGGRTPRSPSGSGWAGRRSRGGGGGLPSSAWTGWPTSRGRGGRGRSATSRSRRSSSRRWRRSQGRDALVDAVDGRRGRAHAERDPADLARLWAAAAPPRAFKLSKDPLFVDKVHDVVGLYLNPPERAVVLCVDEKSQIQALDRTAADPADAAGHPRARHPRLQALRDLQPVRRAGRRAPARSSAPCTSATARSSSSSSSRASTARSPTGLDVHLVLDNSSTHKTPAIQRWLKAHPRFALHFTPTSSSWLNLVERWFAELTPSCCNAARTAPSVTSTATSATGSRPGTTTPSPSPGPRAPTRSSNPSPPAATKSIHQDTSRIDRAAPVG